MEKNESVTKTLFLSGVITAFVVGGLLLYLFSWHDNGGGSGAEIDVTEAIKDAGYYPDGNGWLLSYGWDDPGARGGGSSSDFMRDATLVVDFRIKKGIYVLRIFDETGKEVFNHAFLPGTYENEEFPLGYLGHGYSDADKFTEDYEGSGSWEIKTRSKGYDRIINRDSDPED